MRFASFYRMNYELTGELWLLRAAGKHHNHKWRAVGIHPFEVCVFFILFNCLPRKHTNFWCMTVFYRLIDFSSVFASLAFAESVNHVELFINWWVISLLIMVNHIYFCCCFSVFGDFSLKWAALTDSFYQNYCENGLYARCNFLVAAEMVHGNTSYRLFLCAWGVQHVLIDI